MKILSLCENDDRGWAEKLHPVYHCFPTPMTKGITVLVVDDEELDRSAISQALISNGCSALQAVSYSDAMAVFDLNRHRVQLLVADISLPDGNGCALAVAMHQQRADLKVLFVSGHVGAEVCKYYGLDVNALNFLKKPFNRAELLSRVEEVLRSEEPFPELYVPKTLTGR